MMPGILGGIYKVSDFLADYDLFGVHLMLGQVLDIDFAEVTLITMHGDEFIIDILDLHALQ